MLSSRLTGSSTSITSVSRRSAAVERCIGAVAREVVRTNSRATSALERVAPRLSSPASSSCGRSMNSAGVDVVARPGGPGDRRVPGVAREDLVGALAGLDRPSGAGRPARQEVEGDDVVARSSARSSRARRRSARRRGSPSSISMRWWSVANSLRPRGRSSETRCPRRPARRGSRSSRWRGRADPPRPGARRSGSSRVRRTAGRRRGRRPPSAGETARRRASSQLRRPTPRGHPGAVGVAREARPPSSGAGAAGRRRRSSAAVAGGSFCTPRRMVAGPGTTEWKLR